DATRVIGEALHGLSVLKLEELARSLWAHAWDLDPGTDIDAALVEELLGLPTPVDDEPATVPEPRESAPLDVDELPDEDERQRPCQFDSTSLSRQELECLQAFEQGPGDTAPSTPDDLPGV
ncbi:hypothetical protein ABT300_44255, partial [Streptomyces sp. NPDC001027]|uniref:hypothetical protein n=1 Tax=Streptomyces sp. NPDC001027 TaxID=3154771 RepID=UPI003323C6E4